MALIDHEGRAELVRVDLVCAQQIDHVDLAFGGAVEDTAEVAPALPRHESDIEPAHPGRRHMEDVEAVPAVADERVALRELARAAEDSGTVAAQERALAQDQHRCRGGFEGFRPGMGSRYE